MTLNSVIKHKSSGTKGRGMRLIRFTAAERVFPGPGLEALPAPHPQPFYWAVLAEQQESEGSGLEGRYPGQTLTRHPGSPAERSHGACECDV